MALSHLQRLARHCYDGVELRRVTVDEHHWLAEQFEENRGHLRAVAYRMLGSLSEADDAFRKRGCGSAAPMRERSRI
jgi:hypothetical protein